MPRVIFLLLTSLMEVTLKGLVLKTAVHPGDFFGPNILKSTQSGLVKYTKCFNKISQLQHH